jgi:23S rRNA (cytidine1920-2'-O)/16S rRNA (cytidine1409-2'-O)-methyltransferase
LVGSREDGRRRIMAGEVLVDDRPVTKAGVLVDAGADIRLKSISPYVSRGGLKLERALREFAIDVKGKTALDIGASTGGFTDCLLAHGAAQVIAVDVGYGQLAWKLRNDSRVVVFEKTNVRYLEPSQLPHVANLATIDVSFISLRLVLPQVRRLLERSSVVVALIKPQFEVGKGKVGKGGVVRSHDEHQRVIEEVKAAALGIGYNVLGVIESPLLGPKGNKEFLIHLRIGASSV